MNKNEVKCNDVYSSIQHVLNGLQPFKDKATELVKPFKVGKVPKEIKQQVLNLRINAKIALYALINEASEKYSIPIKHIILVGQFDLSNKL
jgi:hypothetical protein